MARLNEKGQELRLLLYSLSDSDKRKNGKYYVIQALNYYVASKSIVCMKFILRLRISASRCPLGSEGIFISSRKCRDRQLVYAHKMETPKSLHWLCPINTREIAQ